MGLFQTMSLLHLSQCWFRHLKSVCKSVRKILEILLRLLRFSRPPGASGGVERRGFVV